MAAWYLIIPGALLGFWGVSKVLSSSTTKSQTSTNPLSGRTWILEEVGSAGPTASALIKSYVVKSPAKQFGPHGVMPVIQFSQGTDPNDRTLVSRYPGVPVAIYNAAMKDWAVKENF